MIAASVAGGLLRLESLTLRVAIGRAGIVAHKQEGDGGTPRGALPLRRVLYRADRVPRPRAAVPIEPIAPDDGWCDDPTHSDYNRQVRLPHAGGCEELWRRDALYDVVGVLGWNDAPVQRGHGSAIFIHVARAELAPTEGCLALSYGDLVDVLAAGVTCFDIK
jgi:L,D-peptidoglycan transpeptidase YkuD (ErfK/YbiS/YcfS/YnhG family)